MNGAVVETTRATWFPAMELGPCLHEAVPQDSGARQCRGIEGPTIRYIRYIRFLYRPYRMYRLFDSGGFLGEVSRPRVLEVAPPIAANRFTEYPVLYRFDFVLREADREFLGGQRLAVARV